jgi:hypothetical protein
LEIELTASEALAVNVTEPWYPTCEALAVKLELGVASIVKSACDASGLKHVTFGRLVTVYAPGVSEPKLIDPVLVDPLAIVPPLDLDTLTIVFTVNCNLTVIAVVDGENTGDPPAPLIEVIGFESDGGGFAQGGGGSAQALDAAASTPPASIQDAGAANLRCKSPQRLNNSLSKPYTLGAHSFAAICADSSSWRKAISPIRQRAAREPCPAGNAGNRTFN